MNATWKNVVVLYRYIFLCVSAVLMLIALIGKETTWMFWMAMIVWLQNVVYCLENLGKRSLLLCFEASFFLFLLGGTAMSYLTTGEPMRRYAQDIEMHTYFVLYSSQLFLYLGSVIYEKIILPKYCGIKEKKANFDFVNCIRTVSFFVLLVGFIPYLLNISDKIDYASSNGYEALYVRASYQLPYAIRKMSQLFTPALFVYLGTLPKKKKALLPIFMYLLANLWSLRAGARAEFAKSVMVIVFYFFVRHYMIDAKEKWIRKKEVMIAIFMIPVLILLLYTVGNSRYGNEGNAESFIEVVSNLLERQGASIKVIEFGKKYEDILPDNSYVFGQLTEIITDNAILNKIFHFEDYGKQTVKQALYGHNFADSLSYILMPKGYLAGQGWGGCYIAEWYQCYGYIGVCVINIFYGILFMVLSTQFGKNVIMSGVFLIMVDKLIYSPRSSSMAFLVSPLAFTNLMIFAGIYMGAYFIYIRMKGARTYDISIKNQ